MADGVTVTLHMVYADDGRLLCMLPAESKKAAILLAIHIGIIDASFVVDTHLRG